MERKFFIVIRGDSVVEMSEEVLHFAYHFLSRALIQHRHEGENGEYEAVCVGDARSFAEISASLFHLA